MIKRLHVSQFLIAHGSSVPNAALKPPFLGTFSIASEQVSV